MNGLFNAGDVRHVMRDGELGQAVGVAVGRHHQPKRAAHRDPIPRGAPGLEMGNGRQVSEVQVGLRRRLHPKGPKRPKNKDFPAKLPLQTQQICAPRRHEPGPSHGEPPRPSALHLLGAIFVAGQPTGHCCQGGVATAVTAPFTL
jgi:hypothetical protein